MTNAQSKLDTMTELQIRISAITDKQARTDAVRNILRDDMLSLVGTNGLTEEGAINLIDVCDGMVGLYDLYRIGYSMPIWKAYEMSLDMTLKLVNSALDSLDFD